VISRLAAIGTGVFRQGVIMGETVEKDGDTGFMSTSEFDKYKVDHLFLLIGENPLPNYVAARLLLNEGGTPYLVYTSGTKEQAKRLQTILGKELIGLQLAQLVPLNEYESDAFKIQEEICQKLEAIKDGKIGLHYTGGTKAMSVHSYRSLFYKKLPNSSYSKRPDVIFSYLDPRRLEMCIDREEGERDRIKVTPAMLQVKLETVFELHDWKWGSEPTYEPELPEAAQKFAEFHTDGDLAMLWRSWCDDVLRKDTRDNKKDEWKEEKELKNVSPLSFKMLTNAEKINSALNQLRVTGEELSLQSVKETGFKKLKHVCKWLDGEWLEHYVLQKVKEISEEYLIHEMATSFWIGTSQNPKENKFQFDVAFMRGYQLFAISCTTDLTKSLCKSKLFEAYIRAQQLGGSEARVALVCCADKKTVKALKTEITNVFNPSPYSKNIDYKIEVFGRENLINLSNKIAEWIRNVDKETNE
jgi:hypothetical protein